MYALKYLTVAMLFIISGCASSPSTHLYVLQALAEPADSKLDLSIGVGPLPVPEYLNRPQLLNNFDDFRLDYSDFNRWAEPIDEGVLRIMQENLIRSTGSQSVLTFPWRRDEQPDLILRGNVLTMGINMHGNAILRIDWRLIEQKTGQRLAGELVEFTVTAEPGYSGQAKAYSMLLAQFSLYLATIIIEGK